MVDVSLALTSTSHVSKFAPDVRLPYMVEKTVTAAEMIAAKGSAIAAADVYDVLQVPAGTVILGVWARKIAAFAGTSTDLALDIGITGVDADLYSNDWAFDDAALNSYAPVGTGLTDYGTVTNATQIISILVGAQTGTWTAGTIQVYALCIDLSDNVIAGLPALGS